MKLSQCLIVWTPDRPEYSAGMRGKARLFPAHTPREHTAPFACWAGHAHAEAHDPRLAIRHAYLLRAVGTMVHVDGLPMQPVHELLLGIEEYVSLWSDQLAFRRARRAA